MGLFVHRQTNSEPITVPFRAVLASIVILWSAYFLLITLRSIMLGLDMQWELAARRLVVTVSSIGTTLLFWAVLRLLDGWRIWLKVVAVLLLSIPTAITIGHINEAIFSDIRGEVFRRIFEKSGASTQNDGSLLQENSANGQPIGITSDNFPRISGDQKNDRTASSFYLPSWSPLLEIALGRYFLLLAWASTYFSLLSGYQARAAQRREEEFKSAAKEAELRSLRYQINPHFLFNTLNSLSALVITGRLDKAEQMIQTISKFYRHTLSYDTTSDVALSDEFDLQRLYLEIETVRFPSRLHVRFELPKDLEVARVPGLILQPLIENSIKYAVSLVSRKVTITIAASEEFDRLILTVSDDGPGIPAEGSGGLGIGLSNVRNRLEARFGPDIGFWSGPVVDGYKTELRLPLSRPPNRGNMEA